MVCPCKRTSCVEVCGLYTMVVLLIAKALVFLRIALIISFSIILIVFRCLLVNNVRKCVSLFFTSAKIIHFFFPAKLFALFFVMERFFLTSPLSQEHNLDGYKIAVLVVCSEHPITTIANTTLGDKALVVCDVG